MIDLTLISIPLMQLIGSLIVAGLGLLLIAINKTVSKWFLKKIWAKISSKYSHSKLKKSEIDKDTKIREILIELRTIVKADRACLFQFHNGSTFTTKNPIWKVSNTHESVAPGISSEIGTLQDIKASSIIETLQAFWGNDYLAGIHEIKHPDTCDKKIILIDVDKLEDSYSRALLIEQGIKYVIDVPIYNDENNCVGFVAVNYCSEQDIELIKTYSEDVCKNTSQIQFMLLG